MKMTVYSETSGLLQLISLDNSEKISRMLNVYVAWHKEKYNFIL